jgi:hypothetical protein
LFGVRDSDSADRFGAAGDALLSALPEAAVAFGSGGIIGV